MVDGKFGTAINCIDGRTQDPILHWIKENYSIDYVDTITEPGSDKALSEKNIDKIAQIKAKVLISINAHGSKLIVVSGHYDCAANPASKEIHLKQILKNQKIIIFSALTFANLQVAELLKKDGIHGCLKKPIQLKELVTAITN